jgi:hypothetical protein
MSFFDSELVRSEMTEISELQEELYNSVFKFPYLTKEQKIHHIEMMEKLLEKQRVLYTRLSLSDDPQAKEMVKRIGESAKLMGMNPSVSIDMMFKNMVKLIQGMKNQISGN